MILFTRRCTNEIQALSMENGAECLWVTLLVLVRERTCLLCELG